MAGANTAKVTTKNGAHLHVRSGPGMSYPIVHKLNQGEAISVSQMLPKSSDGYTWCRIQYTNEKGKLENGYSCKHEPGINFDYIKITSDPTSGKTNTKSDSSNSSSKKDDSTLDFGNIKFSEDKLDIVNGEQYSRGSSVARSDVKHDIVDMDEESSIYISNSRLKGLETNMDLNHYNAPKFIQNSSQYPPVIGRDSSGIYKYKYKTDHSAINNALKEIRKYNNISTASNYQAFVAASTNYSRYKTASSANKLTKSFAHIFFTRPDLNILKSFGKKLELTDSLVNNAEFYYALRNAPELLGSLVHNNGSDHDFNMFLSNKVSSLQISDEYIKTDTYGDGWTGYKIPFGKHNIESRTAGTLDIGFSDDRDLHCYRMHKIWTEYINLVYRGIIKSKDEYIMKKILDYPASIYYIVTAEDGETIIFWSKYYGIFPTNSPSSVTSYQSGQMLSFPSFSVQYQYAWKRDFDPLTLVEFNYHTKPNNGSKYKYVKNYIKNNLGNGPTNAGAPFIESIINKEHTSVGSPYVFKLRFMPRDE